MKKLFFLPVVYVLDYFWSWVRFIDEAIQDLGTED